MGEQSTLNFYPTPEEMQAEFAKAMGQELSDELYFKLIEEEISEWKSIKGWDDQKELKELADIFYVIAGYCNAKGWDLSEALYRVHLSNMSKLGDDGKPIYRDDGKICKGPNYLEPDMEDLV